MRIRALHRQLCNITLVNQKCKCYGSKLIWCPESTTSYHCGLVPFTQHSIQPNCKINHQKIIDTSVSISTSLISRNGFLSSFCFVTIYIGDGPDTAKLCTDKLIVSGWCQWNNSCAVFKRKLHYSCIFYYKELSWVGMKWDFCLFAIHNGYTARLLKHNATTIYIHKDDPLCSGSGVSLARSLRQRAATVGFWSVVWISRVLGNRNIGFRVLSKWFRGSSSCRIKLIVRPTGRLLLIYYCHLISSAKN